MNAWIIGYAMVGIMVFVILWKKFHIEWGCEANDTKVLIIATPFLWPLVLLLIGGVGILRWLSSR